MTPISLHALTSVLSQPKPDHTDAWIAGVVAVLVALLAAGTAQWRLHVQLNHGRQMADLSDLRGLLEELLSLYNEREALVDSDFQFIGEPDAEADERLRGRISAWANRLIVRLGADDPLVLAHGRVAAALQAKREAWDKASKRSRATNTPMTDPELFSSVRTPDDEVRDALNAFATLAKTRVASTLPT